MEYFLPSYIHTYIHTYFPNWTLITVILPNYIWLPINYLPPPLPSLSPSSYFFYDLKNPNLAVGAFQEETNFCLRWWKDCSASCTARFACSMPSKMRSPPLKPSHGHVALSELPSPRAAASSDSRFTHPVDWRRLPRKLKCKKMKIRIHCIPQWELCLWETKWRTLESRGKVWA